MTLIRLLVYLWVLPNSLLGLLFGLAGRQWRWQQGVLEITDSCFLGLLGNSAQAVTLGHVILARHSDALDTWRAHELRHVRQYELLGPLFLPAYPEARVRAALIAFACMRMRGCAA